MARTSRSRRSNDRPPSGRSGACLFFFQAEDGIRDLTVTGVQTCALPISEDTRLHRFVDLLWQELEGDEAMQPRVFRLIDHAHAAAVEPFDNTVVRDSLVDRKSVV